MKRPIKHGLLGALAIAVSIAAVACQTTYEFQPVGLGDDDAAARVPEARTNAQFLRAVYADLLGRAPETYDFVVTNSAGDVVSSFPIDEQSLLLGTLDGIGDPDPMRAVIVAGLAASPEVDLPEKDAVKAGAFVTEQFHRFLGRDPGTYELAAFVDAWNQDPAVGPRAVVRALIGSREYQSR